jgi:hypothetical protein
LEVKNQIKTENENFNKSLINSSNLNKGNKVFGADAPSSLVNNKFFFEKEKEKEHLKNENLDKNSENRGNPELPRNY